VIVYVPTVTSYILIEPSDIAKLLVLHVLCNSYFLNKPIIVLNLSLIHDSVRDQAVRLLDT
jgi:hypothetical protein